MPCELGNDLQRKGAGQTGWTADWVNEICQPKWQNRYPQRLQISWFSCIVIIFSVRLPSMGGFISLPIMTKGRGPSMAALPSTSPWVQLQEGPLVYQARNGWFQRPKKTGFLVNWVSSYPQRNAKAKKIRRPAGVSCGSCLFVVVLFVLSLVFV